MVALSPLWSSCGRRGRYMADRPLRDWSSLKIGSIAELDGLIDLHILPKIIRCDVVPCDLICCPFG